MKVCLGVIDIPYDYGNTSATTFEVAEILEDKYKLFTNFYRVHGDEVRKEVCDALIASIQNHIQFGAPLSSDEQLGDTIRAFNLFLEREEMAGLSVDGVPTQAALEGKNSRLKRQYGERRPSFIDGGLFKSSFTAWIDNNADS
ncbi:hypothetical protein [Mangrovibacter phragmitis]|uniref:hypothetical protein n=1 Tax=Mangrovibacter phragmitis TaxID=1691903 RepID=UPI00336A74D7